MPEFVLVLECGHLRTGGDQYGQETAYCPRCCVMREIVDRNAGYSYQCMSCPAHGNYGAALVTTRHKADTHRRKFVGHRTVIRLGRTVVEAAGFERTPPQLELPLDVPF